ncbi:hypothetical protein F5B20DRAFT_581595 [Whalleya microplaca]|nr:hypothetical protein F5B20DRAFT_581595 [Whalleya microplaca]
MSRQKRVAQLFSKICTGKFLLMLLLWTLFCGSSPKADGELSHEHARCSVSVDFGKLPPLVKLQALMRMAREVITQT